MVSALTKIPHYVYTCILYLVHSGRHTLHVVALKQAVPPGRSLHCDMLCVCLIPLDGGDFLVLACNMYLYVISLLCMCIHVHV